MDKSEAVKTMEIKQTKKVYIKMPLNSNSYRSYIKKDGLYVIQSVGSSNDLVHEQNLSFTTNFYNGKDGKRSFNIFGFIMAISVQIFLM
jgi:hypothetical protein